MTDQKLLALVGTYIEQPAPEGTPIDKVASESHISNFNVKPFVHLGFVWVHSGSFRKWVGQHTGEWISQKVLGRIFREQGWVAEQGIHAIRINLWGIPVITKEAEQAS